MSIFINELNNINLLKPEYKNLKKDIKELLSGRVLKGYFFGSFANGTFDEYSDIDIILVVDTSLPYLERPLNLFLDLYDLYPAIDLLVYTPREFSFQMSIEEGFWKSVKETMVQFI